MSSKSNKEENLMIGARLEMPAPGLEVLPTSDFQGYILAAESFMKGCITLVNDEKNFKQSQTFSSNFLAGFSLECFLKAYLCKAFPQKYNQNFLSQKKNGSHDIEQLWNSCYVSQLDMPVKFPTDEAEATRTNTYHLFLLDALHKDMKIRYPIGINVIQTPDMNKIIYYLKWFSDRLR